MDYKKIMSSLNDREKIDLAAKLTQAAISMVSFQDRPGRNQLTVEQLKRQMEENHESKGFPSIQAQCGGAIFATTVVFAEMLRFIDSGFEPVPNRNDWDWNYGPHAK